MVLDYAGVLRFLESVVDQDKMIIIPEDKIYSAYKRYAVKNEKFVIPTILQFMETVSDDRYLFDIYSIVTNILDE
jgi:hypothetical protein